MKNLLPLLFAFIVNASFSQTEKYSRIKIHANEAELVQLMQAGLSIDHGEMKKGFWFMSDFSASEIQLIQSLNIKYDVLIDDVKKYYKEQNNTNSERAGTDPDNTIHSIGCTAIPSYPTPSNFALGSMGGFFTFSEVVWHMNNMATLFPAIVKAKAQTGNLTSGGQPIYWMKISDNPNIDETTEQEVFYNAAHHAREPLSVSQLIMYMYYLCENYASNPEIQYLVNNTEMYFIPVVNPDGYLYNEFTDPSGGGMWRKNRADNGDGTYGIDINRNYGYNWGYDNSGSSPNTFSDSYRGASAFSETETKNIRDFCNAHNFKLALNYHSYGNLLIYPWGYGTPFYTPDSAQFYEYGYFLSAINKYAFGNSMETVAYSANGSADDWQYGEQTSKSKIFAMTPEAGPADNGFWPQSSKIVSLCKSNISQNLRLAHLALKYVVVKDDEPNYITTANGYLNYKIKRLGLDAPATYTVSIVPIGTAFASVGSSKTYSSLNVLQEINDSISYSLNLLSSGTTIQYEITVNNGLYTYKDTITKKFGTPVIVFSSDGNSMNGLTSTSWGISNSVFHSASSSLTDSPNGNYPNNATLSVETTSNLDLTDALSAQLAFWSKWEIEPRFDYAQVLVSTDSGSSWIPLCGKYTKTGNSFQDNAQPVYEGYRLGWIKEEMPLDNYIGNKIKIKIQMVSDNGSRADGIYIDDLKVEKLVAPASAIDEKNNDEIFISQNMPNPASEYTYINYSLHNNEKAKLFIYNCFGQLIMQQSLNAGDKTYLLNTAALSRGMYYYCIKTDKVSSQALKLSVVK